MAGRKARRRGVAAKPLGITFSDDFTATSLPFSKWRSCQWNAGGSIRNDNCQTYNGSSDYSVTVANGGTGHERAARFEIRDGDIPFSTTERCEIAEPLNTDVVEGDIRRVEWDMMFDSAFPTPTGNWFIVQQWHGFRAGSSPPLAVNVRSDDVIYMENQDWEFGAPNLYQTAVQNVSAARGVWHHWRYDVLFSPNPAVGWVSVWIDGVNVMPQTSRAHMLTTATESNYIKTGIYRDPVNTTTAIIWHDNIVMTRI